MGLLSCLGCFKSKDESNKSLLSSTKKREEIIASFNEMAGNLITELDNQINNKGSSEKLSKLLNQFTRVSTSYFKLITSKNDNLFPQFKEHVENIRAKFDESRDFLNARIIDWVACHIELTLKSCERGIEKLDPQSEIEMPVIPRASI